MEVALLRAGTFAGLHRGEQISVYPEVAEHPFDAATKRMATVHRQGDGHFAAVKGAPEEVLALADRIGVDEALLEDDGRAIWLDRAERLAAEGLRVLAVAIRPEADPSRATRRGARLPRSHGFPRSAARATWPTLLRSCAAPASAS